MHENLLVNDDGVTPQEEWCFLEMLLPENGLKDLDVASPFIAEALKLRDGVLQLVSSPLQHWRIDDPKTNVYSDIAEGILLSATFRPTVDFGLGNEQTKWRELFGELTKIIQTVG
jgi:hypothetical protein